MTLKKQLINKKSESLFVLYKFLKMIFFVVFLFSSFLFCLYIIGNFQSFSDKSQKYILSLLSVSSIFLILFSICMILGNIILMIKKVGLSRKRLLSIFFYFLSFIFGIFITIFSELIIFASSGI
jgi:hypothetical protein